MSHEKKITIILNPAAGRGQGTQRRAELENHLRRANAVWQILETQAAGDAQRLALRAAQDSYIVAAAGGDGTLGEVVNGLMAAKSLSGKTAHLGLLPLGTGNDFSRCLGVGTELEDAVHTLLHGAPRAIDLGQVSFEGDAPRWFINIAGCGFDASVAKRVNDLRHRPVWRHVKGMPAYLCAVVQELATLRAANVQFDIDGQSHSQRAVLCAVANATSYGGGMRVAPNAQIDDGQFDLCVIGNAGRIEFLRAFPGVFKGTHVSHPKVTMHRATEVHFSSDPPLPVLVDGDVLGTTPATFRLVPRAIEIIAPR